MSIAAWCVTTCVAAFAGLAALSLAMDRHHEDVHGRGSPPAASWLKAAGALGLLSSLGASLAAAGPAQGWVLWFGVLTAAAGVLVALLAYAPRQVPHAALCAFAIVVPVAALLALVPATGV